MSIKNETTMPDGLEYWTADEVANCFSYQDYLPADYDWKQLDNKLMGFVYAAKNATPLGGDGSNGTVETPDGRLDLDNDDKAAHWWGKLTGVEANAIAQAYAEEYR